MEFTDFPDAAFDRWKTTLPDEENEPLTTDWRGDYVGKDDPHYTIGGDVVLKDDLECYVISEFAVIINGELVFNINDTIIDPEHLTEYIESEFGPAEEA